ncbi:hypothetical protein ACEXQE_02330 [Herbiconiux sp. P17]|uniref:hypothetical protein n=1 Tax=Herbiconiux wuyangfengii TaxID=3342794 RepID=UPI0035B6D169
MSAVDDLPPADQLTYWVGALAREDLSLESRVRWLFTGLVGMANPARALFPTEVKRAMDMCNAMLPNVRDAPSWFVIEGKAALRFAGEAHSERNRYIHDVLSPTPESPDRWVRHRAATLTNPAPAPTYVTLDSLRQCRDDLLRAAWRVRGVSLCLGAILDPFPSEEEQNDELASGLGIMRGEFELMNDRGGIIHY